MRFSHKWYISQACQLGRSSIPRLEYRTDSFAADRDSKTKRRHIMLSALAVPSNARNSARRHVSDGNVHEKRRWRFAGQRLVRWGSNSRRFNGSGSPGIRQKEAHCLRAAFLPGPWLVGNPTVVASTRQGPRECECGQFYFFFSFGGNSIAWNLERSRHGAQVYRTKIASIVAVIDVSRARISDIVRRQTRSLTQTHFTHSRHRRDIHKTRKEKKEEADKPKTWFARSAPCK